MLFAFKIFGSAKTYKFSKKKKLILKINKRYKNCYKLIDIRILRLRINYCEGTRQNNSVTSEEGATFIKKLKVKRNGKK